MQVLDLMRIPKKKNIFLKAYAWKNALPLLDIPGSSQKGSAPLIAEKPFQFIGWILNSMQYCTQYIQIYIIHTFNIMATMLRTLKDQRMIILRASCIFSSYHVEITHKQRNKVVCCEKTSVTIRLVQSCSWKHSKSTHFHRLLP